MQDSFNAPVTSATNLRQSKLAKGTGPWESQLFLKIKTKEVYEKNKTHRFCICYRRSPAGVTTALRRRGQDLSSHRAGARVDANYNRCPERRRQMADRSRRGQS